MNRFFVRMGLIMLVMTIVNMTHYAGSPILNIISVVVSITLITEFGFREIEKMLN